MVAIIALLFTSCSTDKIEAPTDDSNSQFTTVTFGALLNDLANKALQKGHFAQVPTCAEAEPAVALIEFSYGGSDYSTTVDILSDASGYFTDYSEDLKIPVPSDGSTMVTVTSFMVYDGDTSVASDAFYSPVNGNLIWIAPKGEDAQFDGYVEDALPIMFEVFPGTKPYFNIEVLCFDRRVVNEYGYVFFDIVPKTIYPLCLFVNYCNEDGRHWVADYAIDLYYGLDANGTQLYNHNTPNAMATTGTGDGGFFADPLCLVIPGPPANLSNDDPYLYLVIYPQDWSGTDNYGDIDNTPVPVALSWNMVSELLNDDGTSNEYLHLLVGECDDALDGDGTISGGGNGENDCETDPTGAQCDPDGDNLTNEEEAELGTNPNDADSDNDGRNDDVDQCPLVGPTEGQIETNDLGCWTDPVEGCATTVCSISTITSGLCYFTAVDLDSPNMFSKVSAGPSPASFALEGNRVLEIVTLANFSASIVNGNVIVEIDGELGTDKVKAYEVQVRPNNGGEEMSTSCFHTLCESDITPTEGNQPAISLEFNDIEYDYPIFVRVKAIMCEVEVTVPQ